MLVRQWSVAMVVSGLLLGPWASRPAQAQDEPGAPSSGTRRPTAPPPGDEIEEEPTQAPPGVQPRPAQPPRVRSPAAQPQAPVAAQPRVAAIAPPKNAYRADPQWQAGHSRRLAGILLTSIGGGVGLGVGALSGLVWGACSAVDNSNPYGPTTQNHCSGWEIATITGLTVLGISLAAGIPLIISGNNQMKRVRNRYLFPQVGFDVRPGGGRVQLSWRY